MATSNPTFTPTPTSVLDIELVQVNLKINEDNGENNIPQSTIQDTSQIKLFQNNFLVWDSIDQSNDSTFTFQQTVQLPVGEKGKPIYSRNHDWMVAILLFALVLLAVVRFSFAKFMSRVIASIFNYQVTNNLFLEKNLRNLRGSIFMNSLFFVNAALFLVQYYEEIGNRAPQKINPLLFLLFLIGLLIIYAAKYVFIMSVGYIFKSLKESREYLHTVFIYNKNLGVFLLPITLSVPFINEYAISLLLYTGLILTIGFYILRLNRGLKILIRKHVSIFYMILYLCALEILPLVMIYKLMKSFV
ncbi:DUF4271 domain-containing protein [Ancylomarina longa]|uniref:DUF4271 domain-containing protein n=1 Tax=Ancylomarina longa TaxID=2487017 RepID=A0A434AWF0_9BACT|nr:DUF4271 domain-containing protein [Ancylomarina longa]RUT78816.1 DUF4271 domain-containing protein [Ancylomarina longa]